ncbi:MAG: response regulator transcription factor, partial [Proteobacteria bacterium]|nr:response regulator transcription factor [Pseudomonadota bacterium]
AITRRGRQQEETTRLTFGELAIDRDSRQITVGGQPRRLTSHQFELLWALAKGAGRVLSRDQLMQAISGHELSAFDRSVDVHISRIRQAIEVDAKKPQRIVTVRGVGYVFTRLEDE